LIRDVSGTGDIDSDNDAFDAVANVLSPDVPILSSPQSGIACAGEEMSFVITPTDGTAYKFYVNGVLKQSGTDNEITFSTDPLDLDPLSNGSTVTIEFSDVNGCEADTSTISYTVQVNTLPSASLSAGDYSDGVCADESVTFVASGGTNYEFLRGGVLVQAKSTSNTYTTSSLTDTQSVTVVVYNANDCTDEATLAMEVLDVSTGGTVTLTVALDANICEGSALTGFISSTAVAVGTDTITYQWQSSINGTAWSDIENENSVNFSPPVLSQTTIFRRLAIVSNGVLTCDTPDDFNISNSITIVVDAAFDLSLTTAQASYCVDDAITFSATSGLTSYTFLINGVSAQVSTSPFLVATVSTTTSTSSLRVKNDDIITVIAEDSNGCTVSNTFTVVASTTPIIATLDTDITGNIICENDTVVLTAGGGSSYSFTLGGLAPQVGEVSGNVFTTSRITDGAVVEVTVTNASGCTASTSMTFEVVSLISAGTVTIDTPDELQVCYNTTLTGTLSSTAPATATDAIHYQWQSSTDGTTYVDIAGENNLNLDLSTLGNLTTSTYFQRQSFAYIDANSSGALDNGEVSCDVNSTTPITIVVDGLLTPTITSSTGGFTFCADAQVTFSANPTNQATYTWTYYNGTSTTSSTGDSTGTATDVTIVANGWIKLEVVTSAGCSYSTTQSITLAGVINTALTAPTTICPSESATISVVATAQATYTFYIGGVVVQDGSSNSLTTTGITRTSSVVVVITNATGCSETVSTTIGVVDLADGGNISIATATICSGDSNPAISSVSSATLESYSSAVSITYFWERSYDQASWSLIPNEEEVNLSAGAVTNIVSTTYFRRGALIENEQDATCETLYSNNTITLTVEDAISPTITSSTGGFTFCADAQVTFSANPTNQATYTWTYYNGTSTTSSTGDSTGTATDVTIVANGWIKLEVVTSAGCSYSTTQSITLAGVINTALTAPTTICPSESATISVVATAQATYTFYIGGVVVQDGSSNSLTTTGITRTSSVVVVITNATGCSETVSTTIGVVDLADGGNISIATATICSGDSNPAISSVSSATLESYSSAVSITYFWERSYDQASWSLIPNEEEVNLSAGAVTNIVSTTYFRRGALIENEQDATCETLYSNNTITLTVEDAISPTITSSTGGFTFCADAQVTFSANPTNQATYTWTYYNGTSTTSSTGDSTGTATDVTIVANGWIKLEVVTSAGCSYSTTQSITLAGVINTALTAPTTICPSESATISVVATAQATYTFYIGGVVVQDGSSNSLTTTGITRTSSVVVVITNATGCSETVSTTIGVVDLADGGNISIATATICSGDSNPAISSVSSATLESYSSAVSITYFWERSYDQASWSLIPNEEEVNLSAGAVTNIVSTTYFRRGALIENEQDATCETLYSNNTITLTVEDAISPTITSSTGGFTFCADAQVTFSANPTNQATYTWTYYNGTSTTSSTGDSTGTATDVTIVANGWIKLEVVTSAGCSYSTTQSITLAGVINTALTAPTTICPSESATISVVATAQATYTFYIGGVVVQDGSSNSLTTTGITRTSSVVVVITNATGCSETVSTTIGVVDLADGGNISIATATICSGDSNPAISSVSSATLESYSSAVSITYFWERSYDQASWSLIPNEEEVNLSAGAVTNIVSTTYFRRGALIENEQDATCETLYSNNTITLTVEDAISPTITSSTGGFTFCADAQVTFSANPTNQATYTWTYYNGTSTTSSTGDSTGTATDVTIVANGWIKLEVVTSAGCSYSTTQSITLAGVINTALTAPTTICPSESATISVVATAQATYTFYIGGVVVQDGSSNSLTTTGITRTSSVVVVITNATGCSETVSTTIGVVDLADGGNISIATATICSGDSNPAISSVSSATLESYSSAVSITYFWERSYDQASWSLIPNEEEVNLSAGAVTNIVSTTYFRRGALIENEQDATCETLYSNNTITLTVEDAISPTITSSTGGFTFCADAQVTFSANPTNQATYTWTYYNGTSTTSSTGDSTGTATDVTIVANGWIKLEVVTSAGCSYSTTQSITLAGVINTALTAPTTICPSESATISVVATAQATYTFYIGGVVVQDGSSNSLTTTGITRTSSVVVVITNATGCSETVSTTIGVVDLADGGNISIATATICSGDSNPAISSVSSATLESYSSAVSITYFWERSYDQASWSLIPNEEEVNLSAGAVTNIVSTTYFRRGALIENEQDATCETLYSNNTITLTVEDAISPTITSSTGGFTFCADAQVTFSANPTNQATYTWTYYNGTSTTSSTGDSTGTATDVTIVANGWIKLEVVTSAGCSYSTTQSITLAGVINTALTAPTTICPSESATISVVATAQATYTFYIGGVVVQDGSSNSLTTTGITRTSSVVVVITNATGCSETVSTTIGVVDLADGGNISIATATICSGDSNPAISSVSSATLESYSSAVSITYFWERSYDQASWSLIPNEEEVNLSAGAVTNIVSTTYFRRGALIENEQDATCETLYSNNTITLTVEDAISPTITSSTGGFTFCADAQVTFSANPTNQATYTWTYYNGTSTTSSTGDSTGTATDVTIVANGWIKLEVVTSAGCSYSTTQSITLAGVINTALTAPTTICPSESATISVVATAQATYTFYIGGVVVQDGSSNSLTTTGITRTSSVVVVITNATGCSETVSTTIGVVDLADGGNISIATATICSGDSNPAISSVSSATLESYSSAVSITYFWERSYDQASWSLIPNEEEVNLSAGAVTNIVSTTYFRRGALIENEQDATCETLYSNNTITLTVEDAISPTITSSTGGFTFCADAQVTFSANPTNQATYTWTYYNGTSTTSSTGDSTGTATDVTIVANGWIKLEVVTSAGCSYSTTQSITLAGVINTALTAPTTICPSESATISVVATAQATYTFYIGGCGCPRRLK
jgi:predicted DNA binding protein